MNPGQIILLNGASSAGKTTLAQALQQKLPVPWQHISLDQFRDGMPGRYRGLNSPPGSPGARGLNIVPVDQGQDCGTPVTHIQFGDLGRKMLSGMRHAIAAFAETGNNVIVDDILLEHEFVQDYVKVLRHLDVLLVGVKCPLAVIEERERSRCGRFPGTATSHFHQIHRYMIYDLEIDTSILSPHRCADNVIAYLNSNASFQAFKRLAEMEFQA